MKSLLYKLSLPLSLLCSCAYPTDATSQLLGQGHASGLFKLSTVAVNTHNSAIVSSLSAGTTSEFVEIVDFGDLSKGNGTPAVVTYVFRVQGNAPYSLNISELNFLARDFRVRHKDVSGSEDHGSFINIQLGSISLSGTQANPQLPMSNPRLSSGTSLDQISQGQVTSQSTVVCTGTAPSLGGTSASVDNGVDISVNFSVPTGMEVGPTPGAAKGSFEATLQMGIFSRS